MYMTSACGLFNNNILLIALKKPSNLLPSPDNDVQLGFDKNKTPRPDTRWPGRDEPSRRTIT